MWTTECCVCFISYVEVFVQNIRHQCESTRKRFRWDIPVLLLIKHVTFRQFDCLMSCSGTGTLMPRKALNGFGNHRAAGVPPGFLVGCDCKCIVSWSDEASPALCCENVRGGKRYYFLCDSHHRGELSRATCDPPPSCILRDAALHGTVSGGENQGEALWGSGHLHVEAVLAVGKAVWNTIVLLKLSGPAEPHNNPLPSFF